MSEAPEVLTPAQAGALLQVSARTVLRLAKEGRIPATRVSTQWRFRRDLILAWMGGQASPQAPARPLSVRALLAPDRMQLRMKAASREAAVQELAVLLEASGACGDGRELARRVLGLGGAALATGAAVLQPGQAAPDLVKGPVAAYGRSLDGVPFGAADGQPTRVFLLGCAARPEEHAGVLEALGRLARNPAFCKEAVLQNAPEGVLRAVEKAEAGNPG